MGVKHYTIYRSIGNGTFDLIETIPGNVATSYADNINSLIGQHNQENLCYYINAESNTDSMGGSFTSHSAVTCIDLAADVFIPNAFTPNGDGVNDIFQAYFAFDPTQFNMIVYNRSGEAVFESNNVQEGWNGRLKGGISAPEGVYVYFISYTSGNGRKISKKGTFSLIYP
jgi:gliding motility-associated-like protein